MVCVTDAPLGGAGIRILRSAIRVKTLRAGPRPRRRSGRTPFPQLRQKGNAPAARRETARRAAPRPTVTPPTTRGRGTVTRRPAVWRGQRGPMEKSAGRVFGIPAPTRPVDADGGRAVLSSALLPPRSQYLPN